MKLNSSRRMGLLRCWCHEHQETKKKNTTVLQIPPGSESLKVVVPASAGSSEGCGRNGANGAKPKKRRGRGKDCQSCNDLSHTLVLGGEEKRSCFDTVSCGSFQS